VSLSGTAVFLSYASQDAPVAERLCNALRSAGIEVWFDLSELRGGDLWDTSIRGQIKSCALFVPMISANTQAREEGYFRREWNLAAARTLDMAGDRTFLLPIVIDGTSDTDARVPDKFREVQWTRLPQGSNSDAFVEHVRRLLSHEPSRGSGGPGLAATRVAAAGTALKPASSSRRIKTAVVAAVAIALLAFAYLMMRSRSAPNSEHGAELRAANEPVARDLPNAFDPPPHSIAVLPFANMSGDKDQEYFSDGLTEELLNSLAEINDLQVAARTSAFSFKGTNTDISAIARKLNVGTVLEGSVRRSAHTIRVTVQLINAITGFHVWSKTYDRDLGDVLKMQTEIATSVASALKVTLLTDIATKIERGGTANPAALDAYLRGARANNEFGESKDLKAAIAAYTDSIGLDPHYALALAARSIAFTNIAGESEDEAEVRKNFDNAQSDARRALAIAPDLAQGHLALAYMLDHSLDFEHANAEYGRALALAPGNAEVLRLSGVFETQMGHFDAGIASIRRAVVLDPLASQARAMLGRALYSARRYQEALTVVDEVISLNPDYRSAYATRGMAHFALGDLGRAAASCEAKSDYWASQQCLAVVYNKMNRRPEAEAMFSKLKALGDAPAYQDATIYAQWGDTTKMFEWLETAVRLRDPGLIDLKTDPLFDVVRSLPRFQSIVRQLKFPN
jgi:TolB-like protein/Flp pilus assembly protein TadD